MNFKDIKEQDIIAFLTLNNQPIDNIYKAATNLINNVDVDVVFTKPIELWLTAFEYKGKVSMTKDSQIVDLFNLQDKKDMVQVLKYLHCYIDDHDYFSLLPHDLLTEILCYSELKPFKQISNKIYLYYKNIISNGWFRKRKCELMLLEKGYDDMNLLNVDYIYNTLCPRAGNVIYVNDDITKLNFYEPVVKVITVKNNTLILTKSGKVLIYADGDFNVTDITLPIDDIIFFNDTYYYLSSGKVYYGFFSLINRYSYVGRAQTTNTSDLKRLTFNDGSIDNILSMCWYDKTLLLLKTNGQLYMNGEMLVDNVLQIASTKKLPYILLKDGTLYRIEGIEDKADYTLLGKITKLIPGKFSCLLMGKESYRANDFMIMPIDNITTGIYNKYQRVVIRNNQIEVGTYDGSTNLSITNPINVFYGHGRYDYYVIVD